MPFLSSVADGEVHTLKDVRSKVIDTMHLTVNDITERLPSGHQRVFDNRLGWARTYLKKAGLISSPKKAQFLITEEGKSLFNSGVTITDQLLAEKYPAFAAFKGISSTDDPSVESEDTLQETPQETLKRVYELINDQLADKLLTEIMDRPLVFFEDLVADLMKCMGYGAGEISGDDGIIYKDRLGFNLIYVQVKQQKPDITIESLEIQKFVGAMMGSPKVGHGLFITTARFSDTAQSYAHAQHIVLVDGKKLCELMIEYGVGVLTVQNYKVKRLDRDYFAEKV